MEELGDAWNKATAAGGLHALQREDLNFPPDRLYGEQVKEKSLCIRDWFRRI